MTSHQRGAALLLVLWVTVLLAALLAGVAASARSHSEAALYGSESVRAQLAAEAGLAHAVAGLRAPSLQQRWIPDGRQYRFTFDGAKVSVAVVDVGGLVDLNAASTDLLQRLFVAAGAGQARAGQWVAVIAARRHGQAGATPAPTRFHAVDELLGLPGMDASQYARLLPALTVYSGRNYPNAAYAGPLALAALRGVNETAAAALVKGRRARPARVGVVNGAAAGAVAGGALVAGYGGTVARVFASAQMPDGTRAGLDVTLRLALTAASARPYKVLAWRPDSAGAP